MMSSEPPPTYTKDNTDGSDDGTASAEPQIAIIPVHNGVNGFQKGYLGAEDEHAAIEGELQVKSPDASRWGRITMSLRTMETVGDKEIELGYSETVLFSTLPSQEGGPSPSTYPFSIPLPTDTPQCLHTPTSSLTHSLTATLYPIDATGPKYSKSIQVHTRRYLSHPDVLHMVPETKAIDQPTRVEVQIPRTTFRVGEPIPLYLTVPPPRRELVLEEGLRLRNIRAELVRVVKTMQTEDLFNEDGEHVDNDMDTPGASGSSVPVEKSSGHATSHSLDLRSVLGVPGGGDVVALSGAAARLHPSKPLRIRLVLHTPEERIPLTSPGHELPPIELGRPESSTKCATVTQTTLLHTVSFAVSVHVTFMHMRSHTERVSTITIPVTITSPVAPLPEADDSLEVAYHKKHDLPPSRTVREDDGTAPHYEAEAGPSYPQSGAPPPFEEREAPPPFFPSEPEASTSRLPTFQESEAEIYVPSEEDPSIAPPPLLREPVFEGEGTVYGFLPSDQFDGHQESVMQERPVTPPPSMEMSTRDTDVTSLTTLDQAAAINALELALEQQHDISEDHLPPPPPPPLDDPSDPPPSIDSDFRVPGTHVTASPPSVHATPAFLQQTTANSAPPPIQVASHGHAPPPYHGVPNHEPESDHERVTRPPPYVDLVPPPPSS